MKHKRKRADGSLADGQLPSEEETSVRSSLPVPRSLLLEQRAESDLSCSQGAWRSSAHRSFVLAGILLLQLSAASLLLVPLLFAPSPERAAITDAPKAVGTITFASSGQLDPFNSEGQSDRLSASFQGLSAPGPDRHYTAWLLPDRPNQRSQPLRLGTLTSLHDGQAQLLYQDPHHQNLLASYSGFCLTEQGKKEQPKELPRDLKRCRAIGWIPQTPTPGDEMSYSQLDHVRHLLAKDPTLIALGLSGGLATWLTRNGEKLFEDSLSARDSWAGTHTNTDAAGLMHRQFIRILDYLDGMAYARLDVPAGTPWLISVQSGRIGLLDSIPQQQPPGYLSHAGLHLMGFVGAPGATVDQRVQAHQIDLALRHVTQALGTVRDVTRRLIAMTKAQLQQPEALSLLNTLVSKTQCAINGEEHGQSSGATEGIVWIQEHLQQFANITVLSTLR